MKAQTATDLMRLDLRSRRAEQLVHHVMRTIDKYLADEHDVRRDVFHALLELFHQEGVEILSDYDRQHYGLPPRGPDGWTIEEMLALEQTRLDALTRPIQMIVPTNSVPPA